MKAFLEVLLKGKPVVTAAMANRDGVAKVAAQASIQAFLYRTRSSEATFYSRKFNDDGTTTAYPQNFSQIKFDKPTIICCGGIDAVERQNIAPPGSDYSEHTPNYTEIGGVMKIIHTALGGDDIRQNPKAPQIFSLSTSELLSNKFNLWASNRFPTTWAGADAVKLAETTLPLISDDYEISRNGTVAGTRLTVDEAIERLSNLTLYGHSYGNSLFRQYSVAKTQHMEQLGYTDEEIARLCNAIVSIATGPVMDTISKGLDPFNSVYLISSDDTSAQKRVTDFEKLVPKNIGDREYKIQYPDLNTAVLWLPPIAQPYHYLNCNGDVEQTNDAHNMRAYTAFSLSDPVRSAYFESVLNNAVRRTGLVSPEALLEPNSDRFAKNKVREDSSPTLPIYPTRESMLPHTSKVIRAIIKQAGERRGTAYAETVLLEKEQQTAGKGGIGE